MGNQTEKKKPIATSITSWSPYTRIFYSCWRCGTDFRFHQDNELFCHRCGAAIDWSVKMDLDEPFTCKEDWKAEKELLAKINELNQGGS